MNRLFIAVLCLVGMTACGQPAGGAILVLQPGGGAPTVKATLSAAATDADAAGKTVEVTSALSAVQSNSSSATLHAWPSDRTLRGEKGGTIGNTTLFRFADGASVDFSGMGRVFAGTGSVAGLKEARPQWWGAVDGVTNTTAVQSAIDSLVAGTLHFDGMRFTFNTATVSNPNIKIIGDGVIDGTLQITASTANIATNALDMFVDIDGLRFHNVS